MAGISKVIINTDPGIDDAMAIVYGLRSRSLAIRAIVASYGNVSVSEATRNVCKILTLADARPWPIIGKGMNGPCGRRGRAPAGKINGKDGLGDIGISRSTVPRNIYDGPGLIKDYITSGTIDAILSLGPLTNIASALSRVPRAQQMLSKIVMMAGALEAPGSITRYAETNAYCDPEALSAVLRSKIPIVMVGLDATRSVTIREGDLSAFDRSTGRIPRAAASMMRSYMRANERYRGDRCAYLHDVICVAVAENEVKCRFEKIRVVVERAGKRGRLVQRAGKPNVRFLRSIDAFQFKKTFTERLCA
ncbi:MAG: nucleoside hydrolase [Candidatus Omnitrophota bacterium]